MSFKSTTTTLSISSPYITSDCSRVVEILVKSGIPASVTSNQSTTIDHQLENGCRIVFGNETCPDQIVNQIWPKFRQDIPGLKCAHLKVDSQYQGCIDNYQS